VLVHRLDRAGRGGVAPQGVDQGVGAHLAAVGEQQGGEHGPRLAPTEAKPAVVPGRLERPEHPELDGAHPLSTSPAHGSLARVASW
jgi:hypothetical protein